MNKDESRPMSADIWVFSEKPALLDELLAGARVLADHIKGAVAAVVSGPVEKTEEAFERGAEKVFWLGEIKPGFMVEDCVPTLAHLAAKEKPYGILIGSTRRGRAVAGRLAARLNLSVITDVIAFMFENGDLQARHMIFGGGAVRVERPVSEMILATVGPGIFNPLPLTPGRKGELQIPDFIEPEWRLTLCERKIKPAPAVNLPAAKKVVCAGRGVAKQEDLALMEELARILGAEVGCTRPLAEGLGWLPRERYIGISGANIKPDLYLGIGVSGQVQHTIGMSEARVVVAINKDGEAPIFDQADYGIVGDLYTIVPALIKALKARK